MRISRRRFIQTGIAGAILLVTAGAVSRGTFWGKGTGRARKGGYSYRFLSMREHQVLALILPVLLAGAFNGPASERDAWIEEVLRALDTGIASQLPPVQKEIRQMMSLLTLPPLRVAVTGVWSRWENAGTPAIDAFLNRWRVSRFSMLKTAYDALFQLTAAAWYGNPKSWPAIGYAGPPRIP